MAENTSVVDAGKASAYGVQAPADSNKSSADTTNTAAESSKATNEADQVVAEPGNVATTDGVSGNNPGTNTPQADAAPATTPAEPVSSEATTPIPSSVIDNVKLDKIQKAQAEDAQKQVENVTEITSSVLDKFGIDIGSWVNEPWVQVTLVLLATIFVVSIVRFIGGRLTLFVAKKVQMHKSHLIVQRIKNALTYTVILLGLNLIIYIMLPDRFFNPISRLIHGFVILLWIVTLVGIGKAVLRYFAEDRKNHSRLVQEESLPLWQNTLTIASIIMSIYLIMSLWGINMSALLASAGIMGIAIGFAAKDTLANLISGVFIIADRPYRIGDYVVLDTGERGKITHIGLRSTRMITRDDVEITIPNSIMGNTKIINESGGLNKSMRIRASVNVAYGSDTTKVRRILLETIKNNTDVLHSPIPRIRLRTLGDSGLAFDLLCWIKDPELRGKTLDTIYDTIHESFAKNKIEIPFNKMDVYMKSLPEEITEKKLA